MHFGLYFTHIVFVYKCILCYINRRDTVYKMLFIYFKMVFTYTTIFSPLRKERILILKVVKALGVLSCRGNREVRVSQKSWFLENNAHVFAALNPTT